MRKFLSFVSKSIAVVFAILLVISAVLAILLVNIERKMFDANLYKGALAEQQVYARLPEIVGNLLTTSLSYNPCAENPLLCEDIPDALRTCYIQKLGEERYITLASGKEKPTEAEMQSIQPCIDQYGGETPAPTSGDESAGGPPDFIKNLKPKDVASIYHHCHATHRTPENDRECTGSDLRLSQRRHQPGETLIDQAERGFGRPARTECDQLPDQFPASMYAGTNGSDDEQRRRGRHGAL
jgi:hypothetical protein